MNYIYVSWLRELAILAEGAIALSVTHSGGVLFASWKLLQFPSSLIVKVILAIFMGASAQLEVAPRRRGKVRTSRLQFRAVCYN